MRLGLNREIRIESDDSVSIVGFGLNREIQNERTNYSMWEAFHILFVGPGNNFNNLFGRVLLVSERKHTC